MIEQASSLSPKAFGSLFEVEDIVILPRSKLSYAATCAATPGEIDAQNRDAPEEF
jgi:hypothetical protein